MKNNDFSTAITTKMFAHLVEFVVPCDEIWSLDCCSCETEYQ